MLSPFPPDSWPFLIRIELRIKNNKRALLDVISCISGPGQNLNILTTQCTMAGHHTSVWQFIVEAVDVARNKSIHSSLSHLKNNQPKGSPRRGQHQCITNILSFHMYRKIHDVDSVIRRECGEHLHDTESSPEQAFYEESRWASESWNGDDHGVGEGELDGVDIEAVVKRAAIYKYNPVRITWQTLLAHTWFYRQRLDRYLSFEYVGGSGLLKVSPGDSRDSIISRLGYDDVDFPCHALAVLDRRENYARVMFSNRDFGERYNRRESQSRISRKALVDINYRGSCGADPRDVRPRPTAGLLRDLLKTSLSHYSREDNPILHMVNALTRCELSAVAQDAYEEGYIRILTSRPQLSDLEPADSDVEGGLVFASDALQNLEFEMERQSHEVVSARHVWVGPEYIFLSTELSWLEGQHTLKSLVESDLAEMGLQYRNVDPRKMSEPKHREDDIIKEIKNVIEGSVALVQIMPIIYMSERGGDTDIKWMIYEYAYAAALGRPIEVCVELDKRNGVSYSSWAGRMGIYGSRGLHGFDIASDVQDKRSIIMRSVRAALALARSRRLACPR